MPYLVVPRSDVSQRRPWHAYNIIIRIIGVPFIWMMIIPIALLDIMMIVYQAVYFSIHNMPKVPRKDFMTIDRGRLKKINIFQKLSCIYCDYAHGVLSWTKQVAIVTEIYSCAIKHPRTNRQEPHQEEYYEHEKFM